MTIYLVLLKIFFDINDIFNITITSEAIIAIITSKIEHIFYKK